MKNENTYNLIYDKTKDKNKIKTDRQQPTTTIK